MAKKYLQLTYQDRVLISHWKARGLSISDIAQRVGVHKSTLSRELRRNAQEVTRETELFYFEMSLLGYPKRLIRKHLDEIRQHRDSFQGDLQWSAPEAHRARQHRILCANQLRRRKSILTRAWVVQKLKQG